MSIMRSSMFRWLILIFLFQGMALVSHAQIRVYWDSLSSIPDREGMAGMFAGVSGGALFCMGGANFPDKRPWEGGKKVWYDRIYRYDLDARIWKQMSNVLPQPAGYGVSVTYKDEIIMVGGSNENGHLSSVRSYKWDGKLLISREMPSLPFPLANMAGCLTDSLLIISGGTLSPSGDPIAQTLLLNLSNPGTGWITLPDIPGPGRTQAMAGSYQGAYYLFGGETIPKIENGVKTRQMLLEVYRLIPERKGSSWGGRWERLPDMPRAATAAANPVPVSTRGVFFIWGGVDEKAAKQATSEAHPGFISDLLTYEITRRKWKMSTIKTIPLSRVTVPSVYWNKKWFFVSGEIRPGVRSPTVPAISIR
jgi:N-acetylneuraminate epimerase